MRATTVTVQRLWKGESSGQQCNLATRSDAHAIDEALANVNAEEAEAFL